tara:strand:- start:263 stop:970 length:708 start_codon:yes stop_codon:yes gene_type:complete
MNPKYDEYINALTVYHCDNKYRLGNKNDGGYVLMETNNYDLLLSGGIGGDIGFEKAFTDKYDVKCFCFDGTEDSGFRLTENEPKIHYIKKNVGVRNTNTTTNFDYGFENYENIFIKLDIEGAEFDLINSFTNEQMKKIKQMVIEFHFPNTKKRWEALKKITKTHYLIHYHANNNNPILYNINYQTIPAVFECTYVRKDLLNNPELNKEPFPTTLDARNTYKKLDYLIDCPPWVHK